MKLGAEPKKIAILATLMVVAIVVYFINSSAGGPSASAGSVLQPSRSAAGIRIPSQQQAVDIGGRAAQSGTVRTSSRQGRVVNEFRPTLKPKRPEDRPDPMTVDPTLRLDVLAKLQNVKVEGVHRSVFEFTQPPAPAAPAQVAGKKPPVPNPLNIAANQPPPKPVVPPGPPPPPPIPMKFFGYVTRANSGGKRAFFLEGEDIHVVTEGDLVKRRYKIIRIGVNSVVVEDTEFKNQQTLPLEEQPG